MPEMSSKAPPKMSKPAPDTAIGQIVQMNPRRVTVTLTLPIQNEVNRPVVTLEWSREDTTMPLSDLLQRIEEYVARYGTK